MKQRPGCFENVNKIGKLLRLTKKKENIQMTTIRIREYYRLCRHQGNNNGMLQIFYTHIWNF